MLQAAGLDTIFTCTESFENSYCEIEGFIYPVKGATYGDDTDFMFMLPLERGSATPFYFDGFKGTGTDTVQINGSFIQSVNPLTNNELDRVSINNYRILNRYNRKPGETDPDSTANTIMPTLYNNTAPLILIITDTFWVFQVGQRPKYYTSREWMDIFKNDYPEKFAQLRKMVSKVLSQ
jgi:hypothetical protein